MPFIMEPDVAVKPREVMPERALTLPAVYYTDEAYFRREMERLFGRMWVSAGRLEEIEPPGQFVAAP